MSKGLKQRYQKLTLPAKASVWFVVCGVLKDAIDVLMTPVFTRILTTEQYGLFNVYISWFHIAKILFTLFLFGEVFNVGLVRFEKDRDRFVSSTLGFVTAFAFCFLIVYLLLRRNLSQITDMPEYLILLMFAHVLAYMAYNCWIRRERYDYHYRQVVAVSFLYIILQPLIGVVAILCLNIPLNPGYTRIVSAVGVQVVIGVVLYAGMMHRGRTFFDKFYWKHSLKTGIELVPFNLSKIVLNQSDRIMINHYTGSGDTGIYSVAHSAAFMLQVLIEALNGAYVPWLYRKLKARTWDGIKTLTNGLLLLVAVGALGIEMIAPEIMKIMGSEAYYQGVNCIPALVYSVYLIFVYTLFANVELFYGRNIFVTAASTVGMITNIVLNAIFIPKYGFVAAGYTTLASYLVICFGHFGLMKRCLKMEEIPLGNLVDIRFLLIISGVFLLFTLVVPYAYQWTILRWIVVVMLVATLVFTRQKWLKILKEMKEDKNHG